MREFIQLGGYTVPTDSIHMLDVNYQQTQSEGGGRCVRAWLNQSPTYPGQTPLPQFLDFRGQEAQAIRRAIRNMGNTGALTVLLSAEESGENETKGKAAGAKA